MAKQTTEHRGEAVSVREAARLLGVCEQTVRKAARLGEIPSFRVLRRVVIPRRAVERLLNTARNQERRRGRRA